MLRAPRSAIDADGGKRNEVSIAECYETPALLAILTRALVMRRNSTDFHVVCRAQMEAT